MELEAALRSIGGAPDAEIDLAGTALVLGALERPQLSLERYLHHLSLLSRDVADEAERIGAPEELETREEALRRILFGRYGYAGNEADYDNLDNVNLPRVIDTRLGLPITLAILYIQTARAQGWEAEGLNFPGHFLVRLNGAGGERAIVDPFAEGRRREPSDLRDLLKLVAGGDAELQPEHFAPAGNRDILLRLQNNIKTRLLADERPEEALRIVESMLMFAPKAGLQWREAGILHAHLGNLRAAVMSLEQAMELAPGDELRQETAVLLEELRTRIN